MFPDLAELVNTGEAAEYGIVINDDMTGQRGVVGKNDVAADDAIVRDVDIGHDPVAVPNLCPASAMIRAPVNRAVFTDNITVTDFKRGIPVLVKFLVLGIITDGAELEYPVGFADPCRAFNHDMRAYPGIIAYSDSGADDRIWPDGNVFTNPGIWINDDS
jgi:hypothetical protein